MQSKEKYRGSCQLILMQQQTIKICPKIPTSACIEKLEGCICVIRVQTPGLLSRMRAKRKRDFANAIQQCPAKGAGATQCVPGYKAVQ